MRVLAFLFLSSPFVLADVSTIAVEDLIMMEEEHHEEFNQVESDLVNRQKISNQYYSPSGGAYQKISNQLYSPNGGAYMKISNQYYNPQGSLMKISNQFYSSNVEINDFIKREFPQPEIDFEEEAEE